MSEIKKTNEEVAAQLKEMLAKRVDLPEDCFSAKIDREFVACDVEKQTADFVFTVPKFAVNPIGSAHGGYIAGILDDCMAHSIIALALEDGIITTSDLQMNYIKAAKLGDIVDIHIQLKHNGKRAIIVSGEMRRNGELLNFGTANFAKIPTPAKIEKGEKND